MAVRSQLSVPLSQNTAPVFKFDCLYTHDLVRKQKRWQDGLLAFHTFNKRVMVYDLTNNFIGDTHWRENEFVQVGDDLRLDRGVLVEVGEAKGRKEQDISEIFAKKNAVVREPSSPLVPVRSSGQKPRSISAVLEAGKRGINGARRAPPPFSIPAGPSPFDLDSQRSPKRRKLADAAPPRRVLVEKAVQSRPIIQPTSSHIHSGAKPAKPAEQATKVNNTNQVEPEIILSKARMDSGPVQSHVTQARKTREDVSTRKRKLVKDLESIGTSKPAKINKVSANKTDESNKASKERLGRSKKSATTKPTEPVAIDLKKSDRPKPKLLASKTRRKKLIFQDIMPAEKDPAPHNTPRSRKTSGSVNQSDHAVDEDFLDHTAEEPPFRDVIVISSPVKDWVEFGLSEDGEGEFPRTTKRSFTKTRTSNEIQPSPSIIEHSETRLDAQPVPEIDSRRTDQTAAGGRFADDIEEFAGLITDDNLLASLADDYTEPNVEDNNTIHSERENSHVLSEKVGKTSEDINPTTLEEPQTSRESPEIAAAALDVGSTTSLPSGFVFEREIGTEAAAAIETRIETRLGGTVIPAVISQETLPARTEPSAAQLTISIAKETSNTVEPPASRPQPQPPVSAATTPAAADKDEKDQESTEKPPPPKLDLDPLPPRQPIIKALAPLAPLLRTANSIPTTLPPQKPLPQFRPPQQTLLPTNTSRSRRSPLQKSLSTSTDAHAASVGESTIAGLARAESDGVVAVSFTEDDYDETGPWSREAFDLFGWMPDAPKGRVLGPVAGRACGCRAAAAAAAVVAEATGNV